MYWHLALLAFNMGIHRSPGDTPHKGLIIWIFDVFFVYFFHLNKLLNKQTSYWWFETPMRLLNKQTSYWWFETPWGSWYVTTIMLFFLSSTAGEPVGETKDTSKWHVTRATCAPLPRSPATLRSPPNGQDRSTPTIMTVFPDRWIYGKTVQYLMQWPLIVNSSTPSATYICVNEFGRCWFR